MSPRASKTKAEEETKPEPTYDEIAVRAYEIHESEGGDELENWFRAEQEVAGRYPGVT